MNRSDALGKARGSALCGRGRKTGRNIFRRHGAARPYSNTCTALQPRRCLLDLSTDSRPKTILEAAECYSDSAVEEKLSLASHPHRGRTPVTSSRLAAQGDRKSTRLNSSHVSESR